MCPLRPASLVVALLFAGCLGDDGPERDAPPALVEPVGCDDGATCDARAAGKAAVNGTSPPATDSVAVHFDGRVGTEAWVCVFAPVRACHIAAASPGADNAFVEGANGTVVAVDLELTWSATSPLTQRLNLQVARQTPGCGDCRFEVLGREAGTSPLVVSLAPEAVTLGEGERLHLYVSTTNYQWAETHYVEVLTEQPFTLAGNVTQRPWTPDATP